MAGALIEEVRSRFHPGGLLVLWGAAARRPPAESFARRVAGRWEAASDAFLGFLEGLRESREARETPRPEPSAAAGPEDPSRVAPGPGRRRSRRRATPSSDGASDAPGAPAAAPGSTKGRRIRERRSAPEGDSPPEASSRPASAPRGGRKAPSRAGTAATAAGASRPRRRGKASSAPAPAGPATGLPLEVSRAIREAAPPPPEGPGTAPRPPRDLAEPPLGPRPPVPPARAPVRQVARSGTGRAGDLSVSAGRPEAGAPPAVRWEAAPRAAPRETAPLGPSIASAGDEPSSHEDIEALLRSVLELERRREAGLKEWERTGF